MIHPNEYLGAGQGLAVPTKIIKQADVVMMLNLFRTRFSTAIKKANWEYYEPRTEHGSSLSACAYAMVATEFGNLDFAYKYFLKTAKIDLEAKYKVYVGSVFMGGSHPAANGGAWMTAVLGFGGVQADEKRVAINPRLCGNGSACSFISPTRGTISGSISRSLGDGRLLRRTNARSRTFLVAGRPVKCAPGKRVTVKYRQADSPIRARPVSQFRPISPCRLSYGWRFSSPCALGAVRGGPRIGADLPWTTYEAEAMKSTGVVLGPKYDPYLVETESSGRSA
jgi:nigerose phosphorylase